jgi:hypothetical protein
MRLLTLLVVPAALLAGPSRYARLGEFQGPVEVQLTAADPWMPAERNLPLVESAWLRTGAGARVEIEFDDGGVWRLGPDSLGEISDYTRLSTGQRITLLSLDHGTAYYTGQPGGKDVIMLVMPGAQVTLLQGSRVRQRVEAQWSQVALLEGQVRFSSPPAEMNLREGTAARVEPATPDRFSLDDVIAAGPLDRWSEERDKLQAAPASAAHVTASYGVADLDSAGKWLSTDDLGVVWKPAVAEDWAPYRQGRWRYFDSLGYTWVSDDSWGWLPYHNGRWARRENVGWVWQPGVSTVFHPGEVYWLRGGNFAGWGPLAPGEQWTAPNPGAVTPQWYIAGNSTYAGLQPDVRTVDGTGFPAPAAEQLKTAFFIPALPSPAFLAARLDAIRPVLRVGSTRVIPSVPGITLGDTSPLDSPSDLMTNPPAEPPPPPPPPVGDAGATPPPDGVYPVPTVAVPVVAVPVVVINPPDHPDYSRHPGIGQAGVIPPGATGRQGSPAPPAATTPAAAVPSPSPAASHTGGSQPVHEHPVPVPAPTAPPAASPVNHPVGEPVHEHPAAPPKPPATPPKLEAPKADPPKTTDKKIAAMAPAEQDFYRQVLYDIRPSAPNFPKALNDLDTWTHSFPNSLSMNDRLYYYVHVYNALGRADQVLDTAAPLVEAGVRNSYRDQQQVLQILVAAAAGVAKLREPTSQKVATGQRAARELLEFLPDYFDPRHKPADVADAAWSAARGQLEGIAKQALAQRKTLRAGN